MSLEWNPQFSNTYVIFSVASQLLLCLLLDKSTAWNRCLQHPCFKSMCKIAQASKDSYSNAQHFLSYLLTHSWFHSMLFALPGYQFPYIVMNRCFYLKGSYLIHNHCVEVEWAHEHSMFVVGTTGLRWLGLWVHELLVSTIGSHATLCQHVFDISTNFSASGESIYLFIYLSMKKGLGIYNVEVPSNNVAFEATTCYIPHVPW